MAAPEALQQLDSWPAILGGIAAAVAAVLVPLNGFVKTLLDYRTEALKAEKLKPEVARDVATTAGGAVYDSMATADLTAAIKDLAAAIRADTASDEAHHSSRLASVLDTLMTRLDHFDNEHRKGEGDHRKGGGFWPGR